MTAGGAAVSAEMLWPWDQWEYHAEWRSNAERHHDRFAYGTASSLSQRLHMQGHHAWLLASSSSSSSKNPTGDHSDCYFCGDVIKLRDTSSVERDTRCLWVHGEESK